MSLCAFVQAAVTVTALFVIFHSTPDSTKDQLQSYSRASLQKFHDSVIGGSAGGSRGKAAACALPERPGFDEPTYQYPTLLHTPVGYGALSRKDNPWRERFLVPLYACNEQETGSQMHVRQLLHLAKSLNRTLVLPNWGFGVCPYRLYGTGGGRLDAHANPRAADPDDQQLSPVRVRHNLRDRVDKLGRPVVRPV